MKMKYICLKKNKYIMNGYCLLPLREKDIYQIKKWRNEQIKVLRQKSVIDNEEQIKYFTEAVKPTFEQDHPKMILFSFLAGNQCIGYGGLTNIDWTAKRAEISFLLATEFTQDRKIYANDFTVFLRLIKAVAFNDLGFNRLYTETYDIRPVHIAVLEKSGFRLEGRLRRHVLIEGEYQDSLIHGILKCDEESGGKEGKEDKNESGYLNGQFRRLR